MPNYEKTLNTDIWLIFSRTGRWPKLSVRMSKKQPSLAPGEIPFRLKIELTDKLFNTPQFSATLTIPNGLPAEASVNLPEKIQDLVKQQLGLTLTILNPEEQKENGTNEN